MIRGLVSRQPVWKTAVTSVLTLTLVIGLSLTIPSLSTIAKGENGVVSANADLKKEDVTKVVNITELTAEEKQEAIDIAKADPRVKELLDMGAMISKVSPMFSYSMINVETGEMEKISETFVKVVIEGNEKIYVAYVVLAEGNVVKLMDYSGFKGRKSAQK